MRLSLEDYSTWVSRELEKQLKPTESRARRLADESRRILEEAARFFEDLSRKAEKDMATKRDPVSYRAARVIGRAAKEASRGLSGIQVPRDANWDSMRSFRDSVSAVSRTLRELRSRASRELSGLYILDMRSFSGVSERIARANEKLTQFLEGEGSNLLRARTLAGILTSIEDVRRELKEKEDEAKSLALETQGLSSMMRGMSGEIDKLNSDNLLREVLETERELRRESQQFRTSTLAHLKRPLRKLRDLAERGGIPLGVEEGDALALYIQSPYRSFLSKTAGPHLTDILQRLKTSLESGKMEFKPRKAARVLAQLEQLLATEHLPARQKKGRELLSRRGKLLRDPSCGSLYQARKSMMLKLDEARQRREELLVRTRPVEEKSEALKKRISELLAQAEAKTREYTGRDVEIDRVQAPPTLG